MIIDITYLRKKSSEIKIKHYAESERDLGLLNHKLDVSTNPPLPHKLRESHGRGGEECKIQNGWRSLRKQGPLNQQEQSSDELTETKAASTEPAWVGQVLWAYIMALVFLWNY